MSNVAEDQKKEFTVSRFQANLILVVCFVLFAINYMDKEVFSVVLEPMRVDLGLTDSQVGLMQSLFFFSLAFFAIPASYLLDRWSRKKSIALMAVFWSAATYITGLGRSFTGVLLPRLAVGVGEAAFGGGGTAMISAAYPQHLRSRVIAIFMLAAPVGSALGAILGGYLSANFGGWRTPFFVFAVPGIVFGILALFLKDYKTVKEVDETGKTKGFFVSAIGLFKVPTLRWLYIGYGLQQALMFAFLAWAPAFIMRAQNVTEAKAGAVFAGLALMAIIGMPLGGVIADLWQKKNPRGRMYVPLLAVTLGTLFFVPAVYLNFKGAGLIFGLLWSIVFTMGIGVVSGITQDVVVPGLKAVAAASISFYMVIFGGGWSPWLIGQISDAMGGGVHGLKMALLMTLVFLPFAAICYWMGAKHYEEDMEKVKGLVVEAE